MEQKKQPIVRNFIQKTLALAAYRSSVMLAKERGAFEIFDAKREEKIRSSTVCVRLILLYMRIC